MPEIISREEAQALGLLRFFTGEPCIRGHICERYVVSRSCLLCKKAMRKLSTERQRSRQRKYARKWRAQRSEAELQLTKDRRREQRRLWRLENPELSKELNRIDKARYQMRHPEKVREYKRRYAAKYYEKLMAARRALMELGIDL